MTTNGLVGDHEKRGHSYTPTTFFPSCVTLNVVMTTKNVVNDLYGITLPLRLKLVRVERAERELLGLIPQRIAFAIETIDLGAIEMEDLA